MSPDFDRWYWNPESIIRVQEFFGPSWELPFRAVTLLSDSSIVLLMAVIVFWNRGRRVAYTALAATMTGAFIVMVIKLGLDVPRPEHADMIAFESRIAPSFPSGHAMHAIAFWGTLAYLRLIRVSLVIGLAIAVMISRIYLGIHYPADLIVGAMVGLVGLLAGYIVWTRIIPQLTNYQLSTLIGAAMVSVVLITPFADQLPNGWGILGGLLGAGTGTLIEARRIGYRPVTRNTTATIQRTGIGVAGLLICGLFIVLMPEPGNAPWLQAIAVLPIGLWATCGAPFVLDRLGLNDASSSAGQRLIHRTTSG